jgi:hypothetical protein
MARTIEFAADGKSLIVHWTRRKGPNVSTTVPLAYEFVWSAEPPQEVLEVLKELQAEQVRDNLDTLPWILGVPEKTATAVGDWLKRHPKAGEGWSSCSGRRRMSGILMKLVEKGEMTGAQFELLMDHCLRPALSTYAMSDSVLRHVQSKKAAQGTNAEVPSADELSGSETAAVLMLATVELDVAHSEQVLRALRETPPEPKNSGPTPQIRVGSAVPGPTPVTACRDYAFARTHRRVSSGRADGVGPPRDRRTNGSDRG